MNYAIIKDEDEFKKFINILPDLKDDEQFYITLFARKKYDINNELKSDKTQLGRTTATKDRVFDKIKKFEVPLGTYKVDGIPVPENCLAVYIHPNPRGMKKASLLTVKKIIDNIGYDRYQNPKSVALSSIQVSNSRTYYVDFDFDIDNQHYDRHIYDISMEATGDENSFKIIKTRGGYHILVEPELTKNKKWHQGIRKNLNVDQVGDLLLPVPGCVQGDYVPKILEL